MNHIDAQLQEVDGPIPEMYEVCVEENNGGDTDYYKVPPGAKMLQDLIEAKELSWNIANVFKAMYRYGKCTHSDKLRDINKSIWFLEREKALLEQKQTKGK